MTSGDLNIDLTRNCFLLIIKPDFPDFISIVPFILLYFLAYVCMRV